MQYFKRRNLAEALVEASSAKPCFLDIRVAGDIALMFRPLGKRKIMKSFPILDSSNFLFELSFGKLFHVAKLNYNIIKGVESLDGKLLSV